MNPIARTFLSSGGVALACVLVSSSAASAQSAWGSAWGDIATVGDAVFVDGGPPRVCPSEPAPRIVEIREADPVANKTHHDDMRRLLIDSVKVPNTTVLLGPNVVLDFSDASNDDIPLSFGACVTLASDAVFRPDTAVQTRGDALGRLGALASLSPVLLSGAGDGTGVAPVGAVDGGGVDGEQPARTPHSQGPLIRFGSHRDDDHRVFLEVRSIAGYAPNDNVRISGFRLYGPSFGQQDVEDIGIMVRRSLGVEISNMEIAGWGGQGIFITDEAEDDGQPSDGPGQQQPNNVEGERMGRGEPVLVFGNYIHHNQHPRATWDNHTAGYGVAVEHGAWAQIYDNVFDFNRHAIEGGGNSGGYIAEQNLVLKGGGVHWDTWLHTWYTHQFDIHGTGDNGFGGQASVNTTYVGNAFQYRSDNAISIRGRPKEGVLITDNVFPHEGYEDDWGDDAVNIEDRDDLDVIDLGHNNVINTDTYGKYGVCDFDGDGVDDLFLATGQSWWFSSFGEFPWSYLGARTERLDQVRLGYFDSDRRCDVLTESDGQWVIASAGTGPWQSIGSFGAPLSEVTFGRFDPNIRDHRPGTKQTTHAFRRAPSGDWLVTPLSSPNWQAVQSSSFAMNKLRFGDFTGDGVTDVLAVQGGRWSISDGAHGGWQRLNTWLSDDVSKLFIVDLDNDNIDDILKLDTVATPMGGNLLRYTLTWSVSDDGRTRWRRLKSYSFTGAVTAATPAPVAFAGRFGADPGGGVLVTGFDRIGHFYSEAERAVGASPDWDSLFPY